MPTGEAAATPYWVNTHKTAAEAISVTAHLVSFERSLLAVASIGREAADAG